MKRVAESLDGMVLPGSAADIDTRRYNARRHSQTAKPDLKRERVDDFLLDYALAKHKPVLAICYGAQILNVHLHGTLVQDIPSQLHIPMTHDQRNDEPKSRHAVRLTGRVAELAGGSAVRVNSSHHQSILRAGRGLRVAARSNDGVVEGVEWIGGPEWIVGVQWHPERMRPGASITRASSSAVPPDHSGNNHAPDAGDALATALFRKLVAEAATVSGGGVEKATVSGGGEKTAVSGGAKKGAVSGGEMAVASGIKENR